jgi:CIC family chloride channel protein
VGLVVVAFILLTENLGGRLYPVGGAAWRRLLIPVMGSLATGFLLCRYFPNARGSGMPQTKIALFLREGYISFRAVAGKFSLCSVSLASCIAGREGPAVQVGAGLASVLGRKAGMPQSSPAHRGLARIYAQRGQTAQAVLQYQRPIDGVWPDRAEENRAQTRMELGRLRK